ncbi:MAG TPA: phosphotransferase [Acidimicrobiales bacterium]|nr:phosphotransferase [Acidimicrobiales bacterium]
MLVEDLEILGSTQGAATRLRLRPRYAEGRDAGLPPVLFLKTSLTRRMLLSDPHMYVTEVRFYERIRPGLDCETPAVYAWGLDEDTSRFAVIIEDLTLRGARFPTALTAVTAEDVAPLMTTLAGLHAANWARADLESEFDWLETSTRGNTAKWWTVEGREVFDLEMKEPYKAEALDPSRHSVNRVFAALARLQEENDREPRTVVHGDTHIGNCYLLPDGTGGLLDWQLMRIANWANDVAYTLMTALDVDERRKSEVDLVRHYLDELTRQGVDAPPWDEAWALYRRQMVYGIVAWMVTPTAMYSVDLLDRLIRRCVTAADDLDSYRLLDV